MNMKSFSLSTGRPLLIDDDDMQILACSWPELKLLKLSPDPGNLELDRPKCLTLRSLVHLARHCPSLEILGLYLDATSPSIPDTIHDITGMDTVPSPVPLPVPVNPFRKLHRLEVGFSPISSHARAAYILAQLLPPSFSIPTAQWRWQQVAAISPLIPGAWKTEWESVRALLPVMLKLRMEGDRKLQEHVEYIRYLENEVSSLQKQLLDDNVP